MKRADKKKGFTLVEVVVACSIFAIGLAGVYGLMAWLMRANAYSNRMTEATAVAQAKIEELAGGQWTALVSGSDTAGPFTRTWTVTAHSSDLKAVDMVVSWSDSDGNNRQITLKTLKSL